MTEGHLKIRKANLGQLRRSQWNRLDSILIKCINYVLHKQVEQFRTQNISLLDSSCKSGITPLPWKNMYSRVKIYGRYYMLYLRISQILTDQGWTVCCFTTVNISKLSSDYNLNNASCTVYCCKCWYNIQMRYNQKKLRTESDIYHR